MVALEAVCNSLTKYQQQLQRGLDLGLIEMSYEPKEEDRVYRVSRILPHIIPKIQLPEVPEVYSLYSKAHAKLYQLWGNKENESEEQWTEIFRLLFADKNNPARFRQGFYQLLKVQRNPEADRVLEAEMRQLKDELPAENLCCQLDNYLRQGDWRKADKETAWLFYLVMVQQGYEGWDELCRKFPSQILKEIDQLWVDYSQGRFGFSIQKRRLYEDIQRIIVGWWSALNKKQLGQKVGWQAEEVMAAAYFRFDYDKSVPRSKKKESPKESPKDYPKGNLPALYLTWQYVDRGTTGPWVDEKGVYTGDIRIAEALFSRLNL